MTKYNMRSNNIRYTVSTFSTNHMNFASTTNDKMSEEFIIRLKMFETFFVHC